MDHVIHTSPVFWIIIVGYFGLILGFGSYFARYNKDTNDFFFSGRRFSWWLITMSIVATGVGSHSFLKYSAKAFEHGFSSTMTYMNDWFFVPFFLFGWLPIVYYTRIRSIPDYFERRFNRNVRILATIAILGYMIGYIAIGFLTMGKTLEPLLGWDLYTIIWVVAIIAGIYITFGGQTAVIFTDLAQGFVLLFAGLLIFILGINYLGGFDIFWNALPPEFKLPLAHFNQPSNFNFVGIFWQDGVAGSVGFLFMNQGLIMRFMATKSVNEGRKAAAFNILFLLPISTVVTSNAGWIGKAISVVTPEAWDASIKLDHVFTQVASLVTSSEVVFAFIIAAVAAALMSTVDTLINAVAAVVINDIYRPIVKDKDDKHYLKAAMFISAGATLLGVIAVTFFDNFPTLYEAHGFFHSTMTPPLVIAIFLGIFWKRYTTLAAVSTFFAGAYLMWLGNKYPAFLIGPFDHGIDMDPVHPYSYIRALYTTFVCLASGVLFSFIFTRKVEVRIEKYTAKVVASAVAYFSTHDQNVTSTRDIYYAVWGGFCKIVNSFVKNAATDESLDGITVWTLDKAREMFKGSKPNDEPGLEPIVRWKVEESDKSFVRFSKNQMEEMAANVGDLVYLSDKRKWLGGLKSVHSVYAEPHDEDGVVYMTPDLIDSGQFSPDRALRAEKEM
jgi:SSS family solute:Na+ symporter